MRFAALVGGGALSEFSRRANLHLIHERGRGEEFFFNFFAAAAFRELDGEESFVAGKVEDLRMEVLEAASVSDEELMAFAQTLGKLVATLTAEEE